MNPATEFDIPQVVWVPLALIGTVLYFVLLFLLFAGFLRLIRRGIHKMRGKSVYEKVDEIDLDTSQYRQTEPREPFFGGNAKAFFTQMAIGIVVLVVASYTIGPVVRHLSCTYVTGTCLEPERPARLG